MPSRRPSPSTSAPVLNRACVSGLVLLAYPPAERGPYLVSRSTLKELRGLDLCTKGSSFNATLTGSGVEVLCALGHQTLAVRWLSGPRPAVCRARRGLAIALAKAPIFVDCSECGAGQLHVCTPPTAPAVAAIAEAVQRWPVEIRTGSAPEVDEDARFAAFMGATKERLEVRAQLAMQTGGGRG